MEFWSYGDSSRIVEERDLGQLCSEVCLGNSGITCRSQEWEN